MPNLVKVIQEAVKIILGMGLLLVALYGIYSACDVTYRLASDWINLPVEPIPNYVGVCISDEGDYKMQYELKGIEKLKETCTYQGTSRDILGCYGDDFYKFQCGTRLP